MSTVLVPMIYRTSWRNSLSCTIYPTKQQSNPYGLLSIVFCGNNGLWKAQQSVLDRPNPAGGITAKVHLGGSGSSEKEMRKLLDAFLENGHLGAYPVSEDRYELEETTGEFRFIKVNTVLEPKSVVIETD